MSELAVIAPPEIAQGLRLAGIPVRDARDAEQAWEVAQEMKDDAELRIVILPEHLAAGFDVRTSPDLLDSERPYFIPLPMDWLHSRDARKDFEDCLRHVLGFRITLSDRILGQHPDDEEAPP
jgi:vacuolar-type H+-ATPase subunit F/Vma7